MVNGPIHITYGKINPRLLINVPPGTSKSLFVSVLWPAWEWGPVGLASLRYLSSSYSESYVRRCCWVWRAVE